MLCVVNVDDWQMFSHTDGRSARIGGRRMWSENGSGLGMQRYLHLVATSTGATIKVVGHADPVGSYTGWRGWE